MFKGTRSGLGYGLRESGGTPFGNDNSVRAGGVGCADDRAEIVRIFDAVEDNEQFGRGRDIPQVRVLLLATERDNALMRFHPRETVERAAFFKSYGRAGGAGEIDDLL